MVKITREEKRLNGVVGCGFILSSLILCCFIWLFLDVATICTRFQGGWYCFTTHDMVQVTDTALEVKETFIYHDGVLTTNQTVWCQLVTVYSQTLYPSNFCTFERVCSDVYHNFSAPPSELPAADPPSEWRRANRRPTLALMYDKCGTHLPDQTTEVWISITIYSISGALVVAYVLFYLVKKHIKSVDEEELIENPDIESIKRDE